MARRSVTPVAVRERRDYLAMDATIPPNPIRLRGDLKVTLFGLAIARIDLDVTITAIERLVESVRRVAPDTPGEFAELSYRELYALARENSVAGRSRMTRDELVHELSR